MPKTQSAIIVQTGRQIVVPSASKQLNSQHQPVTAGKGNAIIVATPRKNFGQK